MNNFIPRPASLSFFDLESCSLVLEVVLSRTRTRTRTRTRKRGRKPVLFCSLSLSLSLLLLNPVPSQETLFVCKTAFLEQCYEDVSRGVDQRTACLSWRRRCRQDEYRQEIPLQFLPRKVSTNSRGPLFQGIQSGDCHSQGMFLTRIFLFYFTYTFYFLFVSCLVYLILFVYSFHPLFSSTLFIYSCFASFFNCFFNCLFLLPFSTASLKESNWLLLFPSHVWLQFSNAFMEVTCPSRKQHEKISLIFLVRICYAKSLGNRLSTYTIHLIYLHLMGVDTIIYDDCHTSLTA